MLKSRFAPGVFALLIACALAGVSSLREARADTTAMAAIACENLAVYLDGDDSDLTTGADLDAACKAVIPPTGPRSIAGLASILGDADATLEFDDIAVLAGLDNNRIDQSCTYQAVIVDGTVAAAGCTLVVVVLVDDDQAVTVDLPAGLTSIESPVSGDFVCNAEGVALGQDYDCSDATAFNGDGVVLFRVLNATATNGQVLTVRGAQEAVEQSEDIFLSSDIRFDTDVDDDTVSNDIDNCPVTPNIDQINTDNVSLVTANIAPIDRTVAWNDGAGDACDADDDNDGLTDVAEGGLGPGGASHGQCSAATANSNPLVGDSDGDRVLDYAECRLGSNPQNAASLPGSPAPDSDGDGLGNAFEQSMGFNAFDADSDDDGIGDGVEFKGYNTGVYRTDTDSDGCDDSVEVTSIDANTVVNSLDMVNVALSFSHTDRPNLDINKSGIVDSADLLMQALNYATTPC